MVTICDAMAEAALTYSELKIHVPHVYVEPRTPTPSLAPSPIQTAAPTPVPTEGIVFVAISSFYDHTRGFTQTSLI